MKHGILARYARLILAAAILSLLPIIAGTAVAAPKIGNVRVAEESDGSGGSRRYVADLGTEQIYVLFDYTSASDDVIRVNVIGSGLELFEHEESYDGEGTGSIPVTGLDIYDSLAEQLSISADTMQSEINDATKQSDPTIGQVIGAMNSVAKEAQNIQITTEYFSTLELTSNVQGAIKDLRLSVQELNEHVADAEAVPADDTITRAQIIGEMSPAVERVELAALTMVDYVLGLSSAPLPETGPDTELDVVLKVRTGLSSTTSGGSASFLVSDQGSSLPSDPDDDDNPLPGATRTAGSGITERTISTPSRGMTPTPRPGAGTSNAGSDTDSAADVGSDAGGSEAADVGSVAPAGAADADSLNDADALADAIAMTDPESDTETGANAPSAAQNAASQSDRSGSQERAAPEATWTVVAGEKVDPGSPQPGDEDDMVEPSGSGPNLAILGFGVLALIGLAFWYRRRS